MNGVYLIHSETPEVYLQHHGVKGQRWGVRRAVTGYVSNYSRERNLKSKRNLQIKNIDNFKENKKHPIKKFKTSNRLHYVYNALELQDNFNLHPTVKLAKGLANGSINKNTVNKENIIREAKNVIKDSSIVRGASETKFNCQLISDSKVDIFSNPKGTTTTIAKTEARNAATAKAKSEYSKVVAKNKDAYRNGNPQQKEAARKAIQKAADNKAMVAGLSNRANVGVDRFTRSANMKALIDAKVTMPNFNNPKTEKQKKISNALKASDKKLNTKMNKQIEKAKTISDPGKQEYKIRKAQYDAKIASLMNQAMVSNAYEKAGK